MNVAGSLTRTAPLVANSEAMAALAREMEAAFAPVARELSRLTETLRRASEAIAESSYVRAKKTKARLVAFLLELLVRARRSHVAEVPVSGVAALEFSMLNDDGPPELAPVLSTHQGSNAPNRAESFTTRTVASRVSGLIGTHSESR